MVVFGFSGVFLVFSFDSHLVFLGFLWITLHYFEFSPCVVFGFFVDFCWDFILDCVGFVLGSRLVFFWS